jgi:hypothetical protein
MVKSACLEVPVVCAANADEAITLIREHRQAWLSGQKTA